MTSGQNSNTVVATFLTGFGTILPCCFEFNIGNESTAVSAVGMFKGKPIHPTSLFCLGFFHRSNYGDRVMISFCGLKRKEYIWRQTAFVY